MFKKILLSALFYFALLIHPANANEFESLSAEELKIKFNTTLETNFEEAKSISEFLIKRGKSSRNQDDLFQGYSLYGKYLILSDDPNAAMEYLSLALKIAEKAPLSTDYIDLLINTARANLDLLNFDYAKSQFEKCLDLSQSISYNKGIANAYNGLGNVQQDLGNQWRAAELYKKSIPFFEKAQMNHVSAGILSNIALLYLELEDFEKSIEYNQQALETLENLTHNPLQKAFVYNNIGIAYDKKGEYLLAREKLIKSLEFHREAKNVRGELELLNNLGLVAMNLNEFMAALAYFEKALVRNMEINSVQGLAINYINLSTANLRVGRFEKGAATAELGLEYARKSGSVELLKQSLQIKAEIAETLENFQMAFLTIKELQQINDSLIKNVLLSDLELLEQKNKQLEISSSLELQNAQLAIENYGKRQKMLIGIIAILGILVLLLAVKAVRS
ncbi:MAG: tetratricopeptide repeat protein [Luteibaculaceae bacterium]